LGIKSGDAENDLSLSLTSRLGNAVCCAFSPVVYNQQALTNKFAGLIMILSAIILRFIVETPRIELGSKQAAQMLSTYVVFV